MHIGEQLELIQRFLDRSDKYNLTAECLLTTINLVKDNPDSELEEILQQALWSWDIVETENCLEDCHD